MINLYLEETGSKDKINFDQAASAEAKFIINELTYSEEYNKIYKKWKDSHSDINNENAAYDASIQLTNEYEKPKENKANERAEIAKAIYKIMTS